MGMSGTHGSILVLERDGAALTITEFSARLVDHVILTVVVMDNILQLFFYASAWIYTLRTCFNLNY